MTAAETVSKYLRLVEERDLERAGTLLADDVDIVFPGGRRFENLDQQVTSSSNRYQSVRKVFERFDTLTDNDTEVVYVFGTLEGVTLEGDRFDSVRFIDRFVLIDGLISLHYVWNDMAEVKVAPTGDSADE